MRIGRKGDKIYKILKQLRWNWIIILLILPIIFGYYLFFLNPQSQFTLHLESDNITNGKFLIQLSGPIIVAHPGPVSFLRSIFSSSPGLDWFLGCFAEIPPAKLSVNASKSIVMRLTTTDNVTYTIGKVGNATCIPIETSKTFSAYVSITINAQQLASIAPLGNFSAPFIPVITPKIEDWSASAQILLFILAWDAGVLLIYEIFKKIS